MNYKEDFTLDQLLAERFQRHQLDIEYQKQKIIDWLASGYEYLAQHVVSNYLKGNKEQWPYADKTIEDIIAPWWNQFLLSPEFQELTKRDIQLRIGNTFSIQWPSFAIWNLQKRESEASFFEEKARGEIKIHGWNNYAALETTVKQSYYDEQWTVQTYLLKDSEPNDILFHLRKPPSTRFGIPSPRTYELSLLAVQSDESYRRQFHPGLYLGLGEQVENETVDTHIAKALRNEWR